MVKWGVPEKILQNAVQTRWPFVKSNDQMSFLALSPHCNYNVNFRWVALRHLLVYKLKFDIKPSFAQRNAHTGHWGSNQKCFFWHRLMNILDSKKWIFWILETWIFSLNEYFLIYFELNIELNYVLARFNKKMNIQKVSARATWCRGSSLGNSLTAEITLERQLWEA